MATDAGALITDRPERQVRIVVADERLTMTRTRFAQGEHGPELHVHHAHTDSFVVLEGRLTLGVGPAGGERIVATAGTVVSIPPGVAHEFRNEGPEDVVFLNLHTPDSGFARYLRGEAPGFDQTPPPADGGGPASAVVVTRPPA